MAGKQMVTAKASKPGKKRAIKHIHITPSKNGGAAIETHFHAPAPKKSAGNDLASMYEPAPEPEMHTTQTPEETGAHVASMMATGYPPSSSEPDGDESEQSE